MSKLVIVAIPEQDDFVWQVSSEKVPHITLLFLGDADTNQDSEEIVQFVEHAATTMSPFYMDADYRGTLGKDDADVIFFEKGWDYKAVSAFRDQLLTNTYIKQAYNSTEQFPEWTPHLTLGYPATPAKTSEEETRTRYARHIHAVSFDRIAVWFGDFEGPEFRLTHKFADVPDMSMSSMSAADAKELLHYGKKGMKWGVIRDKATTYQIATTRKTAAEFQAKADKGGLLKKVYAHDAKANSRQADILEGKLAKRKTKRAVRQDKKFEKDAVSVDRQHQVGTAAGVHFNSRIGGINAKYPNGFTSQEVAGSEKYNKYMTDVQTLSKQSLEHAVGQLPGSPSGRKKIGVDLNDDGTWNLRTVEVKHAAVANLVVHVTPVLDAKKRVVRLKFENKTEDTLTQGEEFVDGLFHYGVKGMKWGKRGEAIGDGSVGVTTATTKKGKAAVSTTGGSGAGVHKDAISAAKTRRVLEKSGTNALSNQDLQSLSQRIQLERQVGQLTKKPPSAGRRFVQTLLGDIAKQQIRTVANDQAAKQVKSLMVAAENAHTKQVA